MDRRTLLKLLPVPFVAQFLPAQKIPQPKQKSKFNLSYDSLLKAKILVIDDKDKVVLHTTVNSVDRTNEIKLLARPIHITKPTIAKFARVILPNKTLVTPFNRVFALDSGDTFVVEITLNAN